MCGLLFYKSVKPISEDKFRSALSRMIWRGPDAMNIFRLDEGTYMGHVRLSILDLSDSANQPMKSSCGRYSIIFNGEIYNHLDIRKELNLSCKTSSDTETILEGFSKIGDKIFYRLDGMFAIVICDNETRDYWVARDRFGIKPLFHYSVSGVNIFSSETIAIREIVSCSVSEESISEWKIIRRPMPGKTFFNEISEVLPGQVLKNNNHIFSLSISPGGEDKKGIDYDLLYALLCDSIRSHEISDVENVCLLSGGVDSALICSISKVGRAYSVGLPDNNEFMEAKEVADFLNKDLVTVNVSEDDLVSSWRYLTNLRGEPLSVPNEGMIYLVCKSMEDREKVILTGEGADEIFFGYDKIFRESAFGKSRMSMNKFLSLYAYDRYASLTGRLRDYIADLWRGKPDVEFMEDFFLNVHLPGLLRRMDGASMAASKEARVPFVSVKLIEYMYRRDFSVKISMESSKIPLREILSSLGIMGPLKRRKIGFSSTLKYQKGRFEEYNFFRKLSLEALGWL